MSHRLASTAAALFACAGLAACGIVSGLADSHLDIEQSALQARIAARFPMQHCKFVIACLELSNPVVVLPEGDEHMDLSADAKIRVGTRESAGRIGFSVRPRYVPAEGQLFLDDVQITTLTFAGLTDEYAALLKQRAPALLDSQLKSHPVYTIDTGTAKGALAKVAVQDVKVVNGKLRISFTPVNGR